MRYESIADIYSANEKLRERFRSIAAGITEEQAAARPEGEPWSIAEIVEHVSIVDSGIVMICSKLLERAKGAGAAGPVGSAGAVVSDRFLQGAGSIANEKLEAPDRVRPSGKISIPESLEKMQQTAKQVEAMRAELEKCDLSAATFPHPYLGDLMASEWLVMYGAHAGRHASQIERLLMKIEGTNTEIEQ
jgi:hypothetical protein